MAATILVTGFGPFPGAPYNPTGPLVERLARLRRPGLADVKIVPHIFRTSYAIVDDELPKLIAKYKPDALLMFGLAPRARTLRIETRARNALAALPDISGRSLNRRSIVSGEPGALALPAQASTLLCCRPKGAGPCLALARRGPLSCNYLCWRAAEAPRKAVCAWPVFVHVPRIARTVRRPGKKKVLASRSRARPPNSWLPLR